MLSGISDNGANFLGGRRNGRGDALRIAGWDEEI